MGDSIIKHLPAIEGVELRSFPGTTIARLAKTISKGVVTFEDKAFVILHVGTNDIGNSYTEEHIYSDYANLIAVIRSQNSKVKIIVSSILPLPVDHNVTAGVICKINAHLANHLAKEFNFS